MDTKILFLRFGAAILLGILIGLQREHAAEEHPHSLAAGIRTFPLLALAGCSASLLCQLMGSPLPLVATIGVIGALLAVHYNFAMRRGDPGLTTKTAAVLTVLAGALACSDEVALAIAVGVMTMLLLSAKSQLHRFVRHMTNSDVVATLKFAIITTVILPILPNRTFGPHPFNVFNPFRIWLFVVFISGISFVGYVLTKMLGSRKGIRLTGFLGGMASSTAVTLSIAQLSREHRDLSRAFASSALIAWTIMFLRVLVVVAVFNSGLPGRLWPGILAVSAVGALWCIVLHRLERRGHHGGHVRLTNPFELGPAIKFGLLFAGIMALVKAANLYLGTAGTYVSSFVSGCADVDAITLSMAKFSGAHGDITLQVASRAILLACAANTIVKGLIIFFTGSTELKKAVLPGWLSIIAAASIAAALA